MPDDAKARKKSLYDSLRRDILTLVLAPGTDLDETSLADSFSLSRTPLREVLQQLAGEGYVTIRENRGSRVSDLSHQTLRDFFLAAPMIYSAVSRLAAQNAQPHQIADLKQAQTAFKTALSRGTAADRTLANNRFHAVIGDMAHNVYLKPSLQRLLVDHARIGMTFYRPKNDRMAANLAQASQQHDALIDSIEAGDDDTAARLTIDHWNLSRHHIEMFVMPPGLDATLDSRSPAKSA